MADPAHTTCWTMIRAAAAGEAVDRDDFARRYEPVIRAYLAIRWRRGPLIAELDDAVQEVFVECYRADGVLQRVEPNRPGGFRAFLYGVTRNVALRVESRRARRGEKQPATDFIEALPETNDDAPSRAFDRAWARSVMRDAAARQAQWASTEGEEAQRRIELLRLRFQENLPIREIADDWQADPVHVHREYAKARKEFKRALIEAISFHVPTSPADVENECARLLALLG